MYSERLILTLTPYKQRALRQGLAWVNGESNHNIIDNECCPDFSCCEPDLFEKDRAKRIVRFNMFLVSNELLRYTE